MFDKIEETKTETLSEKIEVATYETPVLRRAGSAVELVQGHSFLSGYDWCHNGLYTC